VSRHHLRKDKNCLNCGVIVGERYCTHCGQENLEPKETVGHLIRHFLEDITHFDGKFFVTVKDLIIRPGFLTREYVAGRRMSYLNPIRMYIFISAVFFVVLFMGKEEPATQQEDDGHAVGLFSQQLADSLRSAKTDSLHKAFNNEMATRLDSSKVVTPRDESIGVNMSNLGKVRIDMTENKYNTVREYDSVQRTLPDSAREKGLMHWLLRNNVRQKEKRGGRSKMHVEVDVHHDIPKIMFLLLPLFALYVSWFYSRKTYFYVNHAIFTVHFHCFVFLLSLLLLLLDKLIPGDWTSIILGLLSFILVFVYLVAALHGMYRQSFWRSLLKGLGISLLYFITIVVANSLLMVIGFMEM
jgi:hypothetical protein